MTSMAAAPTASSVRSRIGVSTMSIRVAFCDLRVAGEALEHDVVRRADLDRPLPRVPPLDQREPRRSPSAIRARKAVQSASSRAVY